MLGYRSNDAVLTICQNNIAKSIEIVDVNEAVSTLMGKHRQEMIGRALATIIPVRLSALLIEYVEYKDDAHDVGAVLARVQNFSLLMKDGKEKSFRLKVVRGESTRDMLIFKLVLQDALNIRRDDALHRLIQENFKGHEVFHPALGVPDRKSLEKDIELASYYYHKSALNVSFVAIQIDNLAALEAQYGPAQRNEFLKHTIRTCRSNLRGGDVVGAVGDTQLGALLLDAVSDSTRMVANRLRWQIAAQPYTLLDNTTLSLTASMAYVNVDGKLGPDKIIDTCLEKLASMSATGVSQLVEATA